jgi:two-component system, LytTR family, sensor histidine kinase AlgZ
MSLLGRTGQTNELQAVPKAVNAHFYLPDLCSITALLPLILVGQLLALALSLSASQLPAFDWLRFSLLSSEILWIVLTGAALLCRLRPLLQRVSAASGVALCFTTLISVIALVAIAAQWFLSYLTLDWLNSIWIVTQHVAVGGILSGLVLRYFYLQQQLNVQQQAQMQATMQARFQSLQSRIRPHFLFNSMNIIASLIDSDPETAERVVEDMSELFRASLSDAEDLVPLSQELSLCERYINIEQLRLGERLHVNWQKNLHSDQHMVPSLCLQPLIENAIYHGIQPLVNGGTIDIDILDEHNRLQCTVRNPYTQETANLRRNQGNGMALDNLEQRLRARYGNAAIFSVMREPQQFTVSFTIPLETDTTRPGGAT